jgi:predicted DNA-binding transcriptional regulator AlpA
MCDQHRMNRRRSRRPTGSREYQHGHDPPQFQPASTSHRLPNLFEPRPQGRGFPHFEITMKKFTVWMNEVDRWYSHPDPHESVWLGCGSIVAAAGDHAARLGLAEQFEASRQFGRMVYPLDAKAFLAACIGACPPEVQAEPQLLEAADLADLLGITLRSVWRRKADGTLPKPVQLGRLVRWNRTDVERWLAGR